MRAMAVPAAAAYDMARNLARELAIFPPSRGSSSSALKHGMSTGASVQHGQPAALQDASANLRASASLRASLRERSGRSDVKSRYRERHVT